MTSIRAFALPVVVVIATLEAVVLAVVMRRNEKPLPSNNPIVIGWSCLVGPPGSQPDHERSEAATAFDGAAVGRPPGRPSCRPV